MELPEEEYPRDQEVPFVHEENANECEKKESISGDCHRSNGQEPDSCEAGDAPKVAGADSESTELRKEGTHALIDNIAKREQVVNRQGDEAFHPDKGWDAMKQELDRVEQFGQSSEDSSLYDRAKNALDRGKYALDMKKEILIEYWEQVVTYMENNSKKRSSQDWHKWLDEGTRFQRIVEQLEIASCCYKGRRYDYLHRRRRKCFRQLEQWQKEENPRPPAGPSNFKRRKIESRPTGDSCFWFHVENALRLCGLLIHEGPSVDSEREELRKFEKYVMDLINKTAVSADVFLENSTFMLWWMKYEKILAKQMMGHPHRSPLVSFMRNEPRENYVNRLKACKH
ncbi:hypothetical protein EUGRSUZ_C00536 [Eucalyptus grandis]|uniref:EDS1 EP domain-containing protein n=3 Tax=Eucalyptus grandis TaxID=71139 RepID=A0A059CLI5_EUCGR|nr:hypothetical protein EUGRSUZ_C00536 [Eucalyptus grandis]KAK3435811.1 hypothetical protein EUGRSUZ_C00536 [Eucalyptus grandis]